MIPRIAWQMGATEAPVVAFDHDVEEDAASQTPRAQEAAGAGPKKQRTQVHTELTSTHPYDTADAVFSLVAGKGKDAISKEELCKYLVERGDMPLSKIHTVFSSLDTNGDGEIDRAEWRVGFTSKGLEEVLTAAHAVATPRRNSRLKMAFLFVVIVLVAVCVPVSRLSAPHTIKSHSTCVCTF